MEKFLQKQVDIDKILKNNSMQGIKRFTFLGKSKRNTAKYLNNLYFKEIYLYLANNKLPSYKVGIGKVKALAEKYILLDSLLFKISTTPDKEVAVLAMLETCVDSIITLYHSS